MNLTATIQINSKYINIIKKKDKKEIFFLKSVLFAWNKVLIYQPLQISLKHRCL